MAKKEFKSETRLSDAIDELPEAQRDKLTQIAKDMLARQTAPSMKLKVKDDVLSIGLDCQDLEVGTLLQMVDMGTRDRDFYTGLVGQIACLGSHGVCQRCCPPISCGVSDFRGADFGFGVEPDGSGGVPVAGCA